MLVNNSGGPPRGTALEVDAAALEDAVELLLVSAVRLTRLCLPHLRASGRGRVINIESSTVREPADNLALSNAVRPGVIGWAKSLAREVGADGITVNSIAPGRIDTERLREAFPTADGGRSRQIPLRRVGRPREIARRRLLPRLRPRVLRHRHGHPRRRRPHAQPALDSHGLSSPDAADS